MAGKRRADVEDRGGLGDRWRARRERKREEKEAAGPRTWKQRLKRFFLWSFITGLVLALVAVGGFIYLYKTTDIPEPNSEFLTQTTFVYYDNGKTEIGTFATQERDSIPLDEMPDSLKDAVVAAENQSFYSDRGIDPKGILRAAFSNASGNSTQGASTITQQYVKILYLTQERSYQRKVKEAILSLKVQRTLSKEEVLEGYLQRCVFDDTISFAEMRDAPVLGPFLAACHDAAAGVYRFHQEVDCVVLAADDRPIPWTIEGAAR